MLVRKSKIINLIKIMDNKQKSLKKFHSSKEQNNSIDDYQFLLQMLQNIKESITLLEKTFSSKQK